jgi:transposase
LGASDLIYCEATASQTLPNWISSHQNMLHYYKGVTELIVPDNLRSGVTKSHRYEPLCNATYDEFARHYDCLVMPARSYRPKDKSKVEKAVQLVQQRVLAPERNTRFTSLKQLNAALEKHLDALNHRHSKTLGCSRWELFNQYVKKSVDIRVTAKHIEIFHQDSRIACHARDDTPRVYTTVDAHRPVAHRQQALWQSKDRLQAWAQSIGPHTQALMARLFEDPKRHLYQKERSALGILRLSHAFTDRLLELACEKACQIGTHRYDSIESLLKRHRLEKTESQTYQTPAHENVRGPDYYH